MNQEEESNKELQSTMRTETKMRQPYRITDFTHTRRFRARLWRYTTFVFDHLLWGLINSSLLVAFGVLYLLWVLLGRPFSFLVVVALSWYPMPIGKRTERRSYILSAVNAALPKIHTSYVPTIVIEDDEEEGGGGRAECQRGTEAPSPAPPKVNLGKCEFDFDNAIFFLHLCALSYEDEPVFRDVVCRRWGLKYKARVKVSCSAMAVYSEELPFIVVVFKGTSPFNLSEWLTDFILMKTKPDEYLLPGMVHEGLFRALHFPHYTYPHSDVLEGEAEPAHPDRYSVNIGDERATRLGLNDDAGLGDQLSRPAKRLLHYEKIVKMVNSILKKKAFRREGGRSPHIWVTGHSLGAGLGSLFYANLLHSPDFPLMANRECLRGGYVFGTPRTGNHDFAKEIGRHPAASRLHRVINANDIAQLWPLGGLKGLDPRFVLNFEHIGMPHYVGYGGYHQTENHFWLIAFVWNLLGHVGEALGVVLGPLLPQGSRRVTLLGAAARWVVPFCLIDHAPSEYLRHLQEAKLREPNPAAIFRTWPQNPLTSCISSITRRNMCKKGQGVEEAGKELRTEQD